jgi:hypothetical protein
VAFEIQEIAIQMHVEDGTGSPEPNGPSEEEGGGGAPIDQEALVRECVRRVLRVLKDSGER